LVQPAGYYRQKSKHLKEVSAYLLNHYQGNLKNFLKRGQKIQEKNYLLCAGLEKRPPTLSFSMPEERESLSLMPIPEEFFRGLVCCKQVIMIE